MGGDYAPQKIVEGAILATKLKESLSYLGRRCRKINRVLEQHKADRSRIEVVHTTEVIEGRINR